MNLRSFLSSGLVWICVLALALAASGAAAAPAQDDIIRSADAAATLLPAATCTVINTADSGAGSLRQCLASAAAGDTIVFNPAAFPPASPATIHVTSGQLPDLDDGNVTIDASNAGVIVDGSAFSGGEDGLGITSNGNTVKGLQILRFPGDAIEITGGHNTIGGATAGSRNVLSGNGQHGVNIHGAAAVSNTILGNFIGADASGLHRLANGQDGVLVSDEATYNLIGGPATGDRNLIFANGHAGVNIYIGGTQHNTVQGNWIGLGLGAARQAFPTDQAISPAYASDCTLFVATMTAGVYKSTDCGATWAEANTGLTELRLMQVKIPPDAPNAATVFALAEDGALFSTTDGGAHWSLVGRELEKVDRRNLVLSARFSTDHTMYVAAQNWASGELGGQPGVFKSIDGGITWTRAANGMSNTNVWKVIASPDPAAKDTLFALTNGGIQKSTDGGANWAAVPAPDGSFNDLAMSPAFATDHTVVVTAWNGQVYRSTDGGATWTSIASGLGDPRYPAFSPAYATDHTLCHGQNWGDRVACSTDGGTTWAAGNTGLPGGDIGMAATMIALAPNYTTSHTLFAIRQSGIAKSADGGAAWQVLTGLRETGNSTGVSIGGRASLNSVLGNVISNNGEGVRIADQETPDNVIGGNLIGTDPTGAFAQANTSDGVTIGGYRTTVGGAAGRNVISGNLVDGVRVAGDRVTGNVVAGNYIGTNISGTAALGNRGAGISIHNTAHDNLIGGATAAARNLISGNGYGIGIWDSNTVSNTVSGNYIGTDVTGTAALGNGNGIQINNGGSYNVIGGATAGERNVISGNNGQGVQIWDSNTGHNRVIGNYIGVDATGAAALGNRSAGVNLSGGTHHNVVGGPTAGERNVVSGNNDQGIGLWSTGTSDNTVEGNYVGTDASGTIAFGNWNDGVHLNGASRNTIKNNVISGNRDHGVQLCCDSVTSDNRFIGNRIGVNAADTGALPNSNDGVYIHGGAHHNVFGGAGAGEGNLIRNNRGHGVQVQDGGSLANTITRNNIGHNDRAGIALRDGGNANLAAPRITARNLAAGTASGAACANCTVEVFSADDDEGQIYEGTAVANGSGAWALNAGHAFAGPFVTATATDATGNTSPFSSPFNLLVFDMHVANTRQALDNLGLSYTLVDGAGFAAVNLADYDVLFVGFTGNDPQPDSLLQPLLDRKADIAAFVQAGGGLVANSEDGVVRTALDWQWTPVTVTHRNAGGQQMHIALPGHELVEGLTEAALQGWHPFHNTFTQWAWPEAEVVLTDPGSGEAIVLAGAYGAGRMVLSGSDPDYHSGNTGADRLLSNELYWAAKMLRPRPPQVRSFSPGQDAATATTALIQVAFDKLMDAATINAGTLTVVGSASGAHTGTLTYLAGAAQATFAPAVPFTAGERVTATVRGSATDLAGRGLDGNRNGIAEGAPADDFTWSFTVRAGSACLVNSVWDSGPGTLRQCVQDAQPGDAIVFSPDVFPLAHPATITLTSSALPELNRGYVTVDAGNLGVILDGGRLANGSGFRITSAGNAIYGIKIVRFPHDGVQIDGAGAWHNTIGMVAGGRRNVIAANGRNGIRISNGASRNTVGSNFIGLDVPSWAALPNGENGVAIHDGASYNLIGATATVETSSAAALVLPPGNVIFANVNDGVGIWGGGTVSNTVTGNWLGVRPGDIPQALPVDQAISPAYTTDHTIYVATITGGVYKSTDSGTTWVQMNNGLTTQRLALIRIPPDATDANTVYAVSESELIFVTHDGGATWSLVSSVLRQLDSRRLTFSPRFATDHTLYTISGNRVDQQLGGQPGVFKSTDGGVTWSRSSNGLTDTNLRGVFASTDPAATGVLYALGNNSLQKSTDGGANWSAVAIPAGNLQDMALSPAFGTDGTLAVTASSGNGQFLISTDRGATWTTRGDPRHMAFSPNYATDHRVCHGGGWNDNLYCTTDGGATWTQTRTLVPGPSQNWAASVAFAPGFAANRTIFVLGSAGVSRSTDGGATWQLLRSLHDLGNTGGVVLRQGAAYNTIGPGNVIANNNFGVQFHDEATSYNTVIGNLIGLTPDRAKAIPSSDHPIAHWGGQHTRIGGPAAGDGNVIAGGNGAGSGIYLARRESHDVLVQGNRIGTDASGLVALGVDGSSVSIAEGTYNNTLLDNVIAAGSSGISISGSDTRGNRVAGNIIGLGADGRTPVGNRNHGVQIQGGAHDNLVGGETPGDRNLIAGNGRHGVSIQDPDTRNNTVAGNWIGLDASGAVAGNGQNGVNFSNNSHDNLIGGPSVADRNVIAGNGIGCNWCDGVFVGNGAHHNTVQGNFIGTDPTGAVAIPNRSEGVDLWGGNDNAILDNLVSGNGQNQIALWNGAQRNRIEGNRVGTDASGGRPIAGVVAAAKTVQASTAAAVATPRYEPCQGPEIYGGLEELGEAASVDREGQWCGSRPDAVAETATVAAADDGRPGIYISQGASQNTIGVSNTIAFNRGDGVWVENDNALENTISANSIYRNGGLGIRLSNGGNRNLAAPRVLGVNLATGVITGTACAGCRVEVFSTADEEGQTFAGAVVAGGDGKWRFDAGGPLAGPNVTATATNGQGDTSPFSPLVNILWVNLGVADGRNALNRLGLPYTEVSGVAFAGTDLSQYNVLFIGSARWAPNPNYLQPLVDRKADIAAFVAGGGGLVALGETGEWGNGRTPLDWTWLPITVTAQADMGRKRLIAPAHPLAQGLTSNDFLQWYSNSGYYFTAWGWPGATSLAQGGLDTDSQLLAGPYGAGRMALAGSFADADGGGRGDNLLRNLLLWAGGRLADAPPRLASSYPAADGAAAPNTSLRLTFSEIISPTTVTPASLTVVGSRSGAMSGRLLTFADLNVMRFLPDRAFQVGETVTVTVTATIKDMAGNGLDGNGNGRSDGSPADDVQFSFTVRAGGTITVTTTTDTGAGSLSDALERALPGDRIVFDPVIFPPHNPATIGPAGVQGQAVAGGGWLPVMEAGYITIDASDAGVVLDAQDRALGLKIRSDGNVIRGLTLIHGDMNLSLAEGASFNTIGGDRAVGAGPNGQGNSFGRARWANAAIESVGTISNTVRGNHFGTDPKGLERWSSKENYQAGLRVGEGAAYTTVDHNLFSGNSGDGLEINGSDDGRFTNNRLGTDRTGMAALPNSECGVDMQDGAQRNWLQGNLFSGNAWCGLQTDDRGTRNNSVIGNSFGPNASGAALLPGQSVGIYVFECAEQMLVEGNVFGGGDAGIYSRSYNSIYRNNTIGTNSAGTANWHVRWVGLFLYGMRWWAGVDESYNNLVEGNLIAHNAQGVLIQSRDGARVEHNTLRRNRIYGNTGSDLVGDGSVIEDGISLLGGANGGIRPPIVLAANPGVGTANGTACAGCIVEVFSDADDEGRWYEGTTIASGAGVWAVAVVHAFNGPNVHATATDAAGNTSEFSAPAPVVASVSPASSVPGARQLAVTINGDFFRDNPPLTASFGAGISVTQVTYLNRHQVKAYLDIAPSAAVGPRDVRVTGYDGQTGARAAAFQVVPLPPPPPAVNAVIAEVVSPGVTGDLQVMGAGFIDLPRVQFSGAGVTVNRVTFKNATTLWINVTVAPIATLGARAVTVINPDGQSATRPGALTITTPYFTDVAAAAGLRNSSGEHGAAWGDWNRDGWLDLAVGRGTLFTNQTGVFTDTTAAAGLNAISDHGGVGWGDYDNDGKPDLLSSWGKVYRNPGALPFAKIQDGNDWTGSSWVDFDRDGKLDYYAAGRLFRNTGSGFTDVTAAAGLAGLKPTASVWADYNNDGFPDVYFTCNGCPSRLFQNMGGGHFGDVTGPARVGGISSAHGAAWGDYDNDGDLDLFVANNNNAYNSLYRNEGGSYFTEVAALMGLRYAPGNSTGCNWLDYNLDGRLDLFVVGRDSINRLFRNDRTTFTEVTLASGVGDSRDSDGSAVGDFDNDGDPDIYVVSGIWGRGTPDFLFRNNVARPGNATPAWLKVRLQGTLSNALGIGARVRLVAGGLEQVRQIAGSTSYLSQDAPEALFGLGAYAGPVVIEIRWPSGRVETRTGITPNQTITITEPTGRLHDMAMVDVAPAGEAPVNTPLTPMATVRNLGAVPDQAAPVICTISRGGVQVYSQVQSLGVVPPALWASRPFPPFTPTAAGIYILTCRVNMLGDQNGANDALTRPITVTQQIADAWTKDNPDDNGDVPSGFNNWYMSPDLWVRNVDDGGLIHQDPIKGITNTVYVRLRNRGNTAVFTGTVSVYWIEPSLGVRCGGWAPIGVIPFTHLLPGEVRIVSVPWVPTRSGHTCLQDVIDSPQDPYNRGLECAPQWVPWDNNVEWHNVNILASSSSVTAQGLFDIKDAEVQLVNVYNQPQDVDLIIRRMTFPTTGTITVRLPGELFERWATYGAHWGAGIEVMTDTQEIRITAAVSATIGAVPMVADEAATVGLHFEGPAGLTFEMAIEERIQGITTGGVAYQWVIPDTTPPQLIGRTPAADAAEVPLAAPLVLTFDEPIGPLSLKLALAPDPGGWTFTWNAANTVVTATHAALAGNRTYTVTVNANDAAGNPLAPVTWRFTTVDTIAPQVVAIWPPAGATNVALDAALIVTFTEVISPASLNLTLLPNPGGWSYTWSGDGMAVTAQHAALAGQTVYTATVTAKDSAGNALAPAYSWSFTTRRKAFPIYLPLIRRQ